MRCYFWFFYSKDIDFKVLDDHLKNITKPYRIVTNNSELINYLNKKGNDTITFGDLFPNEGKIAEEIYAESKEIVESYSKILEKITFKDVKIFNAFKYHLLLQFTIVFKAKRILKENENIIFIYERFNPAYFIIMKLANELNDQNKIEVGLLNGKKITYLKSMDDQSQLTYADTTSRKRAINFAKHGFGKRMSIENFQALLRFGVSVSSLLLKRFFYRIRSKKKERIIPILNKMDKKIFNKSEKNDDRCAIFLTASRLDLYLRPMLPVIQKFHENKKPIRIFTSDISTSLVLSKEKILFINLFEEVNLIQDLIKESRDGIEIRKLLEKSVTENPQLLGFREILPDMLKKIYRIMAIIVILDHIFKKIKLKSILDGGTGEEFENTTIEVAKKYNVKSYSIVPSPPTPNPEFAEWFSADRLFLEGSQGVEVMKVLGYDQERFEVVGGARYDHYKAMNSINSKDILEKKIQISKLKKLIVIAMSRWHVNDEKWISDFIRFCNKNNFEVILKIHPTYKVASQNVSEQKIKLISKQCYEMKYLITYDADLPTLLSASDLVITDWSSVGLEAVLLDKPMLQVSFTDEEINKYVRYFDFEASIYINEYDELEKKSAEILLDEKHLDKLSIGRQKVIEQYNFRNDGKAAQRIYQILTG